MNPVAPELSDFEARLDEVLAGFLEAVEAGESPDRSRLLANHPDLADELQAFFDDDDWMRQVSRPEPTDTSLHDSRCILESTVISALAPSFVAYRSPDDADPSRAYHFGDYELLEEIGRGGMGIIWKARHRTLNRVVALKMIRSSHLASQDEVDRFRGEAEMAAGLDHPGIVPIFEVGESQGQHYFSMALVDGLNLGELLLREQLLDPQTVAELLRRVADAIGYAHERGVIHRDLKPANILLARTTSRDGVLIQVEGTSGSYEPKVGDFGLAKRIESDSNLTGSGQILGTPSYMSPEQAAGRMD